MVLAAEQHATRLVVPSSRRMPATRWSSHKDIAAKALKKLAAPHLPATLTGLERVGLMQPPTEPAPAATRSVLRGDKDELYRRHHYDLRRAVTHAVNAPRELIEDACQNARTIMLRAQPDRTSIFSWLYVVATREAFRLCERERRHLHLEAVLPEGSWDAVIADAFSIDDILEAREALTILASLPDRQRADLTLLVASTSESCAATSAATSGSSSDSCARRSRGPVAR